MHYGGIQVTMETLLALVAINSAFPRGDTMTAPKLHVWSAGNPTSSTAQKVSFSLLSSQQGLQCAWTSRRALALRVPEPAEHILPWKEHNLRAYLVSYCIKLSISNTGYDQSWWHLQFISNEWCEALSRCHIMNFEQDRCALLSLSKGRLECICGDDFDIYLI